ncbi:MAG: orotidine-5'-phosphate decarboxylase [Acidobacteriota bacterium]
MAVSTALDTENAQDNMSGIPAKERLIVALDLESAEKARAMVDELEDLVEFFKIGLTLQLAPGVEALISDLIKVKKKKVFLDYKYYDIAATLTKAVARAADLGVYFLTVHGTSECIKGAMLGRGDKDLKLLIVTVLTSHDQADIAELGYTNHTVEALVLHRAKKAIEAGCDGVIASGQEAKSIKELSSKMGKSLWVVTPGIRPDGYPEDDQKRRTTPRDAVLAGADYLVLGRPITEPTTFGHANTRDAAKAIIAEMQQAFNERESA